MKRNTYKSILLIICLLGLGSIPIPLEITMSEFYQESHEFDQESPKFELKQYSVHISTVDPSPRVAILDANERPGYFIGVWHNSWLIIYNGLVTEGIDVISITNSEILAGVLFDIDVLILIDNVPNYGASTVVKDWALLGGHVISFDSSICFLNWAGLLPPEAEGAHSYQIYWDYSSPSLGTVVNDAHPIMSGYANDQTIYGTYGDAQYYSDVMISSSVGSYYAPLVKSQYNPNMDLVVALDGPYSGRVVQIWDQQHWSRGSNRVMILNAISWCGFLQFIPATIEFNPDTLNRVSQGKWVTVYIELAEGYDVNGINIGSIFLNGVVQAEEDLFNIGDYDGDGILDLMVKFDRQDFIAAHQVGEFVDIIITGELADGTAFEGYDVIRALF